MKSGFKRFFVKAKVSASVSVDDVCDAFYDQIATQEAGRYWWWVQMVLLDPNEVIVNNGENDLYRQPFTIDGDNVAFGDPVPVKIRYEDVPADDAVAAAVAAIASVRGEKVAAKYSKGRKENASAMKEQIARLRAQLGIAEDVPEDEVLRLAAVRLEAGTADPPVNESGDDQDDDDTETTDSGQPDPEPEPATTAATAAVSVDAETFRKLQQDAAAGAQARDHQITQEREVVLAQAVTDGKFPPSRKPHWEKLMKADPEGTKAMIDQLESNLIPLAARGSNGSDEIMNDDTAALGSFIERHMPDVAARKQAMATSAQNRVATD